MSLFEKLFRNRETLKLVKDGSEIDFDLLYKAMDEYSDILDKIEQYGNENKELKEEVKMLLAELSKYQNGGGSTDIPDLLIFMIVTPIYLKHG